MRRFMEDYIAIPERLPEERRAEVIQLQEKFTIILVKTFLVSLLNAFRDLTLMGVHSFDFNHMNNVLVSRDHRGVRLIDIDGIGRRGSEDYYLHDSVSEDSVDLHPPPGMPRKPSLDIDLVTVLPGAISKLLLGKGRGPAFVTNTGSQIWHSKPDEAREIIKKVLRENFFPHVLSEEERAKTDRYLSRVSDWFYNVYKRQDPWNTYTRDIYDAMRCVDHLPIN
uniref:Protein kinase domain-containing protein n=1 Tax=Minutocellus polymorphus TaxID=265543 RepID=A0A7S0FHH9_9STRA